MSSVAHRELRYNSLNREEKHFIQLYNQISMTGRGRRMSLTAKPRQKIRFHKKTDGDKERDGISRGWGKLSMKEIDEEEETEEHEDKVDGNRSPESEEEEMFFYFNKLSDFVKGNSLNDHKTLVRVKDEILAKTEILCRKLLSRRVSWDWTGRKMEKKRYLEYLDLKKKRDMLKERSRDLQGEVDHLKMSVHKKKVQKSRGRKKIRQFKKILDMRMENRNNSVSGYNFRVAATKVEFSKLRKQFQRTTTKLGAVRKQLKLERERNKKRQRERNRQLSKVLEKKDREIRVLLGNLKVFRGQIEKQKSIINYWANK